MDFLRSTTRLMAARSTDSESTSGVTTLVQENFHAFQQEFYPNESASETLIEFDDDRLQKKLLSLSNDADLLPLVAFDMATNKSLNFSQSPTWEVVFAKDWQNADSKFKLSKWCDQFHSGGDHQDIMQRFDDALHRWIFALNLDDSVITSAWFRPPSFPSTLSMYLFATIQSIHFIILFIHFID